MAKVRRSWHSLKNGGCGRSVGTDLIGSKRWALNQASEDFTEVPLNGQTRKMHIILYYMHQRIYQPENASEKDNNIIIHIIPCPVFVCGCVRTICCRGNSHDNIIMWSSSDIMYYMAKKIQLPTNGAYLHIIIIYIYIGTIIQLHIDHNIYYYCDKCDHLAGR